jgi:tetratricopeptide (TPR) repeat protein
MITKDSDFKLNMRRQLPDGKRYIFAFIALFAFLLIIYGNSFHGEWHFDDKLNILQNANVHLKNLSWPDIKETFYFRGSFSRPVSYFSFALNYYFGGLNVFGYHLVNLAIHYISAIFLFLFIYNTLRLPILRDPYGANAYSVALLSTFIWAVSPVQVLAVSYIVQRMASMAGMFYIMAMYFYLKGRTSDDLWKGIAFFVLCFLSALLSIGCKQNAAMLPASLFLFDLFLIQGVTGETIKKNIKIAVIPLLILLALGAFYTNMSSILGGYSDRPFALWERLLTEPRVILFYISLLLYPVHSHFTMLHDIYISRSLVDPWTTLPAILLIAAIIGYAIYAARKRPLISFCIIFFFLNHLIEGSVIPLELIYEHRNYIPSMLFFVPVAILILNALDYLSYRKCIQIFLALGIAFLLYDTGHTVYGRNETLKTDLRFWTDNVTKYPNLSRPHNNLGCVYLRKGLRFEAFHEFRKATQLNRYMNLRNEAVFHFNLGQFFQIIRKDNLALAQFKKAFSIRPDYAPALYGISMVELKKGNTKAAYEDIIKALEINPRSARQHRLLSLILLRLGRLDDALKESQKTLELNPEDALQLAIIAEIYREKGENKKAIQYWEAFIKKKPQSVNAHLALIELYFLTEQNNLLRKTIGWLMDVKGNKDMKDFLCESTKDTGLSAYTPDTEKILNIISDYSGGVG